MVFVELPVDTSADKEFAEELDSTLLVENESPVGEELLVVDEAT